MATEPVAGGAPPPDARAVAREVNTHILALEALLTDERFLARDPRIHMIGFLCECGCLGIVVVTRDAYETNGGAWLEGHSSQAAA
jgi:hypothetical protein